MDGIKSEPTIQPTIPPSEGGVDLRNDVVVKIGLVGDAQVIFLSIIRVISH